MLRAAPNGALVIDALQVFHDLLEFVRREAIEVLFFMAHRLLPERSRHRLSLRRQLELVPAPVFLRAHAVQPAGRFRLVKQRDQARLIDVHCTRQFHLGRTRIGSDELQQAGKPRPDAAVGDMLKKASPELHHGEAYMETEQPVERLGVDRPPAAHCLLAGFLAGLAACYRSSFMRYSHYVAPMVLLNDVSRPEARQISVLFTPLSAQAR